MKVRHVAARGEGLEFRRAGLILINDDGLEFEVEDVVRVTTGAEFGGMPTMRVEFIITSEAPSEAPEVLENTPPTSQPQPPPQKA